MIMMNLGGRLFRFLCLFVAVGTPFHDVRAAKYFNHVYYPCADWGPDLEAKDPEKSDEVIYFVKMIVFSVEPSSPSERLPAEPPGPWVRFWFCKMNWDGSNKNEICELWADQNPSVAREGGTMWLDVCPKANKATFSVEYGNSVTFGLWVIDLDGKNLRRLALPKWTDTDKRAYVHPSFHPNGEEVVFSAIQHDPSEPQPGGGSKLGIVTVKTGEVRWLTDGPRDIHPGWSPSGDWIVYTHYKTYTSRIADRRIWLIKPDGKETKELLDSKGKEGQFGWWPAWSPDGRWIYVLSGTPFFYVVDVAQGKTIVGKSARGRVSLVQWGRKGFLSTGLGTWLVPVELPQFDTKGEVVIGPVCKVPTTRFADVSTYENTWGVLSK